MYLLRIGCVLQVFGLVAAQVYVTVTYLPYPTMKAIVNHVKDLLVLMDEKIEAQRRRISAGRQGILMDGDQPKVRADNVSDRIEHETDQPKVRADNVSDWIEHETEIPKVRADNVSDWIENVAELRETMPPINLNNIPLEPLPEQLPQLPAGWLNDVTTIASKTVTKEVNAELFKLDMIKHMEKERVGYCEATVIGLASIIIALEDDEVKSFLDAFGNTFKRMESHGKLVNLGDLLIGRIKQHWVWASITPADTIKANAHILRDVMLALESADAQISKIFNDYNAFFEVKDGDTLLTKVADLYEFTRKQHENPSAVEGLMEYVIDALIAPANKMQDSFELRALLYAINKAYQQRYPDFRRSDINAVMNTILDYNRNKTPEAVPQRRMNHGLKHMELKNLLRYLLKKHPSILRTFFEHHSRTKKHKHRHNKGTSHHRTRYHKKHYHGNHKHHNSKKKTEKVETTTISKQVYSTTKSRIFTRQSSMSSSHILRTLSTKSVQKQVNPDDIAVIPEFRRISPSLLTRRVINYNETKQFQNLRKYYKGNIVSSSKFTRKYLNAKPLIDKRTTKLSNNNTMLEKIMKDSSYSDEENDFKSMFNDAIHHWSHTLASKSHRVP